MNEPSDKSLDKKLLNDTRAQIIDSIKVKQLLLNDLVSLRLIEKLLSYCLDSLRSGGKIIFAGNGGSFADAQHLSAELTSRFLFDRAPLASLALGTNNSAMSAIGNDYGYDKVFARELEAIANPRDVFIPISTSGNSPNIMAAVIAAKDLGLITFALTGRNGGILKNHCQCLIIPSNETARIQECHILVGHILCQLIEREYFNSSSD